MPDDNLFCARCYYYPRLRHGLVRHADGRSHNKASFLPRPGWPPFIALDDVALMQRNVKGVPKLMKKLRGRPGSMHIDWVISGPPSDDSAARWDRAKVEEWSRVVYDALMEAAGAALRGLGGGRGGSPFYGHLHTAEGAPHVHAGYLPVWSDPDGKFGVSWEKVQSRMADHFAGCHVTGGRPAQMRAIQSGLAGVSARFGLKRGRPSDRKHEPPDRIKGLHQRIGRLTEERDALRTERDGLRKELEHESAARGRAEAPAAPREGGMLPPHPDMARPKR